MLKDQFRKSAGRLQALSRGPALLFIFAGRRRGSNRDGSLAPVFFASSRPGGVRSSRRDGRAGSRLEKGGRRR